MGLQHTQTERLVGVGGPLLVCRRYAGLAHFGEAPCAKPPVPWAKLQAAVLGQFRVGRLEALCAALAMRAGKPQPWHARAPMKGGVRHTACQPEGTFAQCWLIPDRPINRSNINLAMAKVQK